MRDRIRTELKRHVDACRDRDDLSARGRDLRFDMLERLMDIDVQGNSGMEGRRILVVEDEAMLALDITLELEDAGADVTSATTLKDAVRACSDEAIDGAILDVDLRGHEVYPAAEILMERGVPFVFHTGHGKASDIAHRFPGVPVVSKPASEGRLRSLLNDLMAPAQTDQALRPLTP